MGIRRIKVNGGNLRVLCASRGGSAAVEFAVVLPLLMLIMFGTLQISLLMVSYNLMISAARDTARALAVGTLPDPATAQNFDANAALSVLPGWVPRSAWTVQATCDASANGNVGMTISVDPAVASLITYLPLNLPLLTTHIVAHKEPLSFGAGTC